MTGNPDSEVNVKEAFSLLQRMKDVHILIHRSPDGDCIGGGCALHFLLQSMGIRSRIRCADPIPAAFAELTEGISEEEFSPQSWVAVDLADKKLLGALPAADKESTIALCIDHHISNTHYAEKMLLDSQASATCEILYYLIRENQLPMTKKMALCLYVGMATDTGCFQYDNAGAKAFAAVADLKRAFPDLPYARLNRSLFVLKSKGRIALDARLMQRVQMDAKEQVALIYVPNAWMEELHISQDETDGISNLPMQIDGVEIGITVKEQPDGSFRISMRGGERADVSAVCRQFGGGGHIKAGGCSIAKGNPEEVCRKLIQAAAESL